MGINYSTPKGISPQIDHTDIKLICQKLVEHTDIELANKLKMYKSVELKTIENIQAKSLSKKDLVFELMKAVKILKELQALKTIKEHSKKIDERSPTIADYFKNKKYGDLEQFMVPIESIIYASTITNLCQLTEFNKLVFGVFGADVFTKIKDSKRITDDLKNCTADPNGFLIWNCLDGMLKRNEVASPTVVELIGEKPKEVVAPKQSEENLDIMKKKNSLTLSQASQDISINQGSNMSSQNNQFINDLTSGVQTFAPSTVTNDVFSNWIKKLREIGV